MNEGLPVVYGPPPPDQETLGIEEADDAGFVREEEAPAPQPPKGKRKK